MDWARVTALLRAWIRMIEEDRSRKAASQHRKCHRNEMAISTLRNRNSYYRIVLANISTFTRLGGVVTVTGPNCAFTDSYILL